jgi:tyrosinase
MARRARTQSFAQLVRRGKPVPQWQRTPANARERKRTAVAARGASTFRPPLLRIPKSQLLLAPLALSPDRLLFPFPWWRLIVCGPTPKLRVRKNQKDMTPIEWDIFLCTLGILNTAGAASPTFAEFVDIHRRAMDTMAGMAWGAHEMGAPGMDGRNFLPWHREYLAKLEARLMAINPLVTIPYWNSVVDRSVPPALTGSAFLSRWGITRGTWAPGELATTMVFDATMAKGVSPADFRTFEVRLEQDVHNGTHRAVGGTMGTSTSPADPVFWLHHAFIDKCWADWQRAHPTAAFNPANLTEVLQPPPIMTRKVSDVLSTTVLGYVYA